MAVSQTRKLQKHLDIETKINELAVDAAFKDVLRQNEIIISDNVFDECVRRNISLRSIRATIPSLFKMFRKDNLIVKTHNYALSHRHHKPLPWYVSQLYTGKRLYTLKDGYLKTLDGSKLNVD